MAIVIPDKKWVPRWESLGWSFDQLEILENELERHGETPIRARLMALRGVTPEDRDVFLRGGLNHLPDPFLMKGMDVAAARIVDEIRANRPLLVCSDYDVDGVTGATVLTEFFHAIGVPAYRFIPHRKKDGYGLSRRALDRAAQLGLRLVISVDCGISDVEMAAYARKLNLELIISDHHIPPPVLPESCAIVNPHQAGCGFPDHDLCGAGVAFFLAAAVRKRLREAGHFKDRTEPDMREALDLVAMAVIADLVPMRKVNRLLVRAGLRRIAEKKRLGLAVLQDIIQVKTISSGVVGFQIAPRLNAAGRLDDARLAADLLSATDPVRADQLARKINSLNEERQAVEKAMTEDAIRRVGYLESTVEKHLASGFHQGFPLVENQEKYPSSKS